VLAKFNTEKPDHSSRLLLTKTVCDVASKLVHWAMPLLLTVKLCNIINDLAYLSNPIPLRVSISHRAKAWVWAKSGNVETAGNSIRTILNLFLVVENVLPLWASPRRSTYVFWQIV